MRRGCIISTRYDPYLGGSELLAKTILESINDNQYNIDLITFKHSARNLNEYNYKIFEIDENILNYNKIIKEHKYDFCLFICDLNSEFLQFYDFSCNKNFCILNLDERIYEMRHLLNSSINNLKKFDLVFTFTKNGVANKFFEEYEIKNTYVQNFSRDVLATKIDNFYINKIKNLFSNKENKIILYPAAFEERKNQKYILNHINNSALLKEFNWLFIGHAPDEQYLKDCINFSLRNNIDAKFIKGTANTQNIDKLYQSVDLVCLTSIAEGMPLVLLEALSANLPWICTDVGGVRGVLGETDTGVVIPVNFSQIQIYETIKKALNLKENSGRNFWKNNFTINLAIEKYKKIIEEEVYDNV